MPDQEAMLAGLIQQAIAQFDGSNDFVVRYEPDWPRSLYVIYRTVSETIHVRVSAPVEKLSAEMAREIALHVDDVRRGIYRNFHCFESQDGATVWQATLGGARAGS